jgi:hypothetical protein
MGRVNSLRSKVPTNIKEAIRKAAKYNAKAKQYEDIVERWFAANGVEENDSFRDTFIDCVQQSPDPERAIEVFERYLN